jgi:predicted TIM-barrel fold metal-dependent hydrolase
MNATTIHGTWVTDPSAVTLIDTHHHLWDLDYIYYPWLADKPVDHFFIDDIAGLRRNYLPDDYRRDAQNHNVLKTVHVEAECDRGKQVVETEWLTAVNEAQGMPSAIVAHAWFDTGDAEETIARQAGFPLVRGIRSKPVTSSAPGQSVAGQPGTMRDPRWLNGLSLLEKYDLTWDLRVPAWHLEEASEVAAMFPRINMALNHLGFPWDRSDAGLAAWRRGMEALARHPNVHLKVSEFGLKGQPWHYESNRKVVRDALGIFGIDRCMFASNAPVSCLKISFDSLVRSLQRMVADYSEDDQARFFWRNAETFYRL